MSDRVRYGGIELYSKDGQLHKRNFGGAVPRDPEYCSAAVWDEWSHHQCKRKGRLEEHGVKWCKQHLPSNAATKTAHRDKGYELDLELREAGWARNDARHKIADTAIDYFDQKVSFEDIEQAVIDYGTAKGKHEDAKQAREDHDQ